MARKIQVIIEYYDKDERVVEGTKIETDGTPKRFREKGVNVDEFKKLVRKKYGESADIINKVRKQRDVPFGQRNFPGPEVKSTGEKLSTKDIVDLMKNKYED